MAVNSSEHLAVPTSTDPQPEQLSLLWAINVLLRNRRFVIAVPIVIALLTAAVTLLTPQKFRTTSRFVPEAGDEGSRIGSFASQLGISVGGESGAESPEFYRQLISSRDLLRATVNHHYSFPINEGEDTVSGNLVDIYEIDPEGPENWRMNQAIKTLDLATDATLDLASSIVTVRVTAKSPVLATQINRRMLELVEEFNRVRRQSQANAERAFTDERLKQGKRELEANERRMAQFLEQNREYRQSPPLMLQYAGLQREVELSSQLYTILAQSLEKARIEAVRNTPVISVIDVPEGSAMPTARRLQIRVALALIAGFMLAAAIAFIREAFIRRKQAGDRQVLIFMELLPQSIPRWLARRFRRNAA